jgi:hypothetical protein
VIRASGDAGGRRKRLTVCHVTAIGPRLGIPSHAMGDPHPRRGTGKADAGLGLASSSDYVSGAADWVRPRSSGIAPEPAIFSQTIRIAVSDGEGEGDGCAPTASKEFASLGNDPLCRGLLEHGA